MNEGQYRVDDALLARLNELDGKATAAVEAGDGETLARQLEAMWQLVQSEGERLPPEDLHPSDVLVPPSDLSLEETRELIADEGLIPDLPVRS
jgi:hypothetical protein